VNVVAVTAGLIRASRTPAETAASTRVRRLPLPAYRFDVVAIGVKNERSIVLFSVVRTKAGLPIVDTAGFKRRLMEGVNGVPGCREKRHMHVVNRWSAVANPKHRIRGNTESDYFVAVSMLVAFQQAQLEWFKGASIEVAASLQVCYRQVDVVDHLVLPCRSA
jgi:hypothetical protein